MPSLGFPKHAYFNSYQIFDLLLIVLTKNWENDADDRIYLTAADPFVSETSGLELFVKISALTTYQPDDEEGMLRA